jgi:hypothetical protein
MIEEPEHAAAHLYDPEACSRRGRITITSGVVVPSQHLVQASHVYRKDTLRRFTDDGVHGRDQISLYLAVGNS